MCVDIENDEFAFKIYDTLILTLNKKTQIKKAIFAARCNVFRDYIYYTIRFNDLYKLNMKTGEIIKMDFKMDEKEYLFVLSTNYLLKHKTIMNLETNDEHELDFKINFLEYCNFTIYNDVLLYNSIIEADKWYQYNIGTRELKEIKMNIGQSIESKNCYYLDEGKYIVICREQNSLIESSDETKTNKRIYYSENGTHYLLAEETGMFVFENAIIEDNRVIVKYNFNKVLIKDMFSESMKSLLCSLFYS